MTNQTIKLMLPELSPQQRAYLRRVIEEKIVGDYEPDLDDSFDGTQHVYRMGRNSLREQQFAITKELFDD